MAYNKQAWANGANGGTPVTSDRLNHMEDGIESANSGNEVRTVHRVGPVDRPASLETGGPNSAYYVADREDALNDATVVFRTAGAVTAEIGVNGDSDPDKDSDVHLKVVTGLPGSEIFTDALIARYENGDVWIPNKLGVGTVPAEKMHVAANQNTGRVLHKVENTNLSTGSQSAGIQLQGGASSWTASTDVGQNGGNNFAIQSGTIGYTPVIMADSSGRVGVGTDSPAAKFHVAGAVFLANVTAASVSTPTGGGTLFVDVVDGSLKFKGSGGNVTVIAPA